MRDDTYIHQEERRDLLLMKHYTPSSNHNSKQERGAVETDGTTLLIKNRGMEIGKIRGSMGFIICCMGREGNE